MRRFLVVIEDAGSEFSNPEALHAFLQALFDEVRMPGAVKIVKPGGLVASYLLDELPPPRHRNAGVYR